MCHIFWFCRNFSFCLLVFYIWTLPLVWFFLYLVLDGYWPYSCLPAGWWYLTSAACILYSHWLLLCCHQHMWLQLGLMLSLPVGWKFGCPPKIRGMLRVKTKYSTHNSDDPWTTECVLIERVSDVKASTWTACDRSSRYDIINFSDRLSSPISFSFWSRIPWLTMLYAIDWSMANAMCQLLFTYWHTMCQLELLV